MSRKRRAADEAAAENRARETLLESGWQLRAGRGDPAVIVAVNGERTLYGSSFADIVGRALLREQKPFLPKTRQGRAQRAAA